MDQTLLLFLYHYAIIPEITPVIVFVAVWLIFLAFIFALLVEFLRHQRDWRLIVSAFLSAATGAVAASAFAFLLPMSRPFLASSDQILPLISVMNPFGSLPSGHTATMVAFGFGLFFAGRKSGIVYAMLGVVIGFARVAAGVHYPSDVLVGIVFGIVSGGVVHQVFRLMEEETDTAHSVQEFRR